MPRSDTIQRIADLTNGAAKVTRSGDGWPDLVDVAIGTGSVRIALFGGEFATKSYRGRDDVERRMQNPGQNRPVTPIPNAVPIILGLWTEGPRPIVVAFDAGRRFGKTTRQSFFASLPHLAVAVSQGWTSYKSGSDEEVFMFWPSMLPAYVEMVRRGVRVDSADMAALVDAAGLSENMAPLPPEERVRRTASALVRRAAFSAEVVQAYDRLCAMCGLNFGLVQGAHIYPAAAPSSSDDVRNGLALCANHHSAFDRHLVFVEPTSRRVQLHPSLAEPHVRTPASEAFIATTLQELRPAKTAAARPRTEMFEARYKFFSEAYDWAA
jgi:hypothetical protein